MLELTDDTQDMTDLFTNSINETALEVEAAGFDNIPAELIKNGGEGTIDVLHKICNSIWKTGEWPSQWTRLLIIPLPKKGSLLKCNNYRTISLISHPSKVLLRVICNLVKLQVEGILSEEQAGFRPGRSTGTDNKC